MPPFLLITNLARSVAGPFAKRKLERVALTCGRCFLFFQAFFEKDTATKKLELL